MDGTQNIHHDPYLNGTTVPFDIVRTIEKWETVVLFVPAFIQTFRAGIRVHEFRYSILI